MSKDFPPGMTYYIGYDPTTYIQESINAVYQTLVEALVLVVPIIAIPISLIGTMAVLFAADYSINNLSLFRLVLAIGIVVDDAIVAIENVERLMEEEGIGPCEAAHKTMDEVSGAIIAISLVLVGVVYVALILVAGWRFIATPSGFIPQPDQGFLISVVQLSPGSSAPMRWCVKRSSTRATRRGEGRRRLCRAGRGELFEHAQCRRDVRDAEAACRARRDFGTGAGSALSRVCADHRAATLRSSCRRPVQGHRQWRRLQDDDPGPGSGQGYQRGWRRWRSDDDGGRPAGAVAGAFTTFNAGTPRLSADIDRERAERMDVPVGKPSRR